MAKLHKCRYCGEVFESERMTGKFCTNACRQKMYRYLKKEQAELTYRNAIRYGSDRQRNGNVPPIAEQLRAGASVVIEPVELCGVAVEWTKPAAPRKAVKHD